MLPVSLGFVSGSVVNAASGAFTSDALLVVGAWVCVAAGLIVFVEIAVLFSLPGDAYEKSVIFLHTVQMVPASTRIFGSYEAFIHYISNLRPVTF